MATLAQHELIDLIIQWVRDNSPSSERPNPEITVDTDLMAAGLLDSLGFVDLVIFIEGQCKIKINLADVDPAEFTVVKGLCDIALSSANSSCNGDHQQSADVAVTGD